MCILGPGFSAHQRRRLAELAAQADRHAEEDKQLSLDLQVALDNEGILLDTHHPTHAHEENYA